jgi:hypothetical protein
LFFYILLNLTQFSQNFQFDLADRWEEWPCEQPSMIIDTTVSSKIQEPYLEPWRYFCKEKNGFFVKYEICCSIGVPRIVWLKGPFKPTRDDTIAKDSGIKQYLGPTERMLADKIYKGDRRTFICPVSGLKFKLPREDQTRNYMIYSARGSVERLIRRMKVFGFFHMVWRLSLELHQLCTHVIGKLINLFLIFEPLG